MTAMQLNYIANASVPSASGRTIPMIDPSDGQPFDEIQRSNAADIDAAVRAARTAESMSAALLRWISSKGCPSEGSSTCSVRPEEDGTSALAMKLSCMERDFARSRANPPAAPGYLGAPGRGSARTALSMRSTCLSGFRFW